MLEDDKQVTCNDFIYVFFFFSSSSHVETNPCENSPCRHDSICVTKSNHDVQCICSSNYTGRYCENTGRRT